MLKQMSSKKIVIALSAATLVVAAVIMILLLNKEEAYRSIMVYDMEGSAVIERADIGTIDAAENLYLESGDRVSVDTDSLMRMKLDSDKYITAESDTIFSLEAQGDGQNSKTKINLEQGAITNEIQNPLSQGSTYETATPNSVMAVRGTIYRVELCEAQEGGQDMRLCCFEGTVATMPILPDGTAGEEVLVRAGSELTVYNDGTVSEVKNIDYETLSLQALRTLSAMADNGADIAGITGEEIAEMISSYEQEYAAADRESGQSERVEDEQKASASPVTDQKPVQDNNTSPKVGDNRSVNDTQNNRNTVGNGQTAGNETKQTQLKPEANTSAAANPTNVSGSTNTSNVTDDQDAGDPDVNDQNTNNQGSNDDIGGGDASDDDDRRKPDDDSDRKPEKPSEPVTYTVTFQYDGGKVFATQTVIKGAQASEPVLKPDMTGKWDFNFDTPITSNVTIEWRTKLEISD